MICLVQIDRKEDFALDVMPLGPLTVGSALHRAGFPVKIIHCTEDELESVSQSIVQTQPLFVGLSVITGPQTLHSALLSEMIKEEAPQIPIVWAASIPPWRPNSA